MSGGHVCMGGMCMCGGMHEWGMCMHGGIHVGVWACMYGNMHVWGHVWQRGHVWHRGKMQIGMHSSF